MSYSKLLLTSALALTAALPLCAKEKLVILNQGLWNANNGSISYFEDGTVVSNHWFQDKNGYNIGDTPQDIINVADNLIAVSVNTSNIIQYMDYEGNAVAATEDIPNNRYMASDGKYLYISSYAHECTVDGNTVDFEKGFVAKIDVSTYQIVATCEVGYEPDGIAYYDGHIFVANSGGYAYTGDHEYESTVSIIDTESMTIIRNVDTGCINLYGKVSQSGQYLCINSCGDYNSVGTSVVILDCDKALKGEDDCFKVISDVAATYSTGTLDGKFYVIGSAYSYISGSYTYNYLTIDPAELFADNGGIEESLPSGIQDEIEGMTQPYGIYVNPYTGYIYATDAGNYTEGGTLYQWNQDGTLIGTYTLYINPAHCLALAPDELSDGIEDITVSSNTTAVSYYDIQGRKLSKPQSGLNIVKNADGSVSKVIIK
jgi:hypothetical protein